MKTYIVDYGEGAAGGRYALIQADSFDDAWLTADAIADPFFIAELEIPFDEESGGFYMEIDAPEEPFAGAEVKEMEWQLSWKTGPFWGVVQDRGR